MGRERRLAVGAGDAFRQGSLPLTVEPFVLQLSEVAACLPESFANGALSLEADQLPTAWQPAEAEFDVTTALEMLA